MELINNAILWMMMSFMLLGALDRLLSQWGDAEQILGKVGLASLGRAIGGAGKQFEEGFMAMGSLGLAMVGVIAAAPLLAGLLGPLITPLYKAVGASPATFATTLLANDMGGYFLAKTLATEEGVVDSASWLYAGLLIGAMLGPTVSFTIPVGLGLIAKEDRPFLAVGVLLGLVTIPVGCLAGGLVAMLSPVVVDGAAVPFTVGQLLSDTLPIIAVSLAIATGLFLFPKKTVNAFQYFAKAIVSAITVALALAVWQSVLQVTVVPGFDPIFMGEGDTPGHDLRAMELIGYIACILLGAYPMVFLLTRWLSRPLPALGRLLAVNDKAAAGLIATLANSIPMFTMLHTMDRRGKVLNVAFAVSAAFTFGDHLGFTAANMPAMIAAVLCGKLVGGLTALALALLALPYLGRLLAEEDEEVT